jgi:hypothetical protein
MKKRKDRKKERKERKTERKTHTKTSKDKNGRVRRKEANGDSFRENRKR